MVSVSPRDPIVRPVALEPVLRMETATSDRALIHWMEVEDDNNYRRALSPYSPNGLNSRYSHVLLFTQMGKNGQVSER